MLWNLLKTQLTPSILSPAQTHTNKHCPVIQDQLNFNCISVARKGAKRLVTVMRFAVMTYSTVYYTDGNTMRADIRGQNEKNGNGTH